MSSGLSGTQQEAEAGGEYSYNAKCNARDWYGQQQQQKQTGLLARRGNGADKRLSNRHMRRSESAAAQTVL
jgi:hypothetical protein